MKNAIEDIVNCAALILLLAAVRCVAVLDAHAMTVCRSDTVNCFVGTGGTGHCFPAAAYPFGLVQAGPDTGWGTWDYCSGYRYEDGQITMFSQTHNPGGGCPDYADVGIMPFVGDAANVVSTFSHENETATPGYYAVSLDRGGIRVEIAASEHSAIYCIRPEHPREMRLLVDLDYGMGNRTWAKKTVEPLDVRRSEDGEIRAHLLRNGFVKNRHIGVNIRCNPAPVSVEELSAELGVHAPKYVLSFNLPPDGQLFVKLGLSTTDGNGAARNLDCEIPAWDFDAVRLAARAKWDEVLSRVEVDGTDTDANAVFATALYHMFLVPTNIADVDGRYRGADGKIAVAPRGRYYSELSLWDTFRGAHPFYTIAAPEYVPDFVNSMLAHFDAAGYLPVLPKWGQDSQCMIATHSVAVIADAFLKGFDGIDWRHAYSAVRDTLRKPHDGRKKEDWHVLDQYGYYPCDMFKGEGVSRTLECSYDDWCAAKMAEGMGELDDAEFFRKRAENWRNVFDAESGFMRGRLADGSWRTPFDPYRCGHESSWEGDFTEGNAWQWRWHVLQDPEGLFAALGGRAKAAALLDGLFALPSNLDKTHTSPDVTGLWGQYVHGNEPSHHIPYLYQYAGRPDRAAERVGEICRRFYRNAPDGLCGNEDHGEMSAWYVFSCLGFYPLNPSSGEFVIGAPQVKRAAIRVGGDKKFVVVANGLSESRRYVNSISLNGKPLDGFIIGYKDIMAGGELVFEMTKAESKVDSLDVVDFSRPDSLRLLRGKCEGMDEGQIAYRPDGATVKFDASRAEEGKKDYFVLALGSVCPLDWRGTRASLYVRLGNRPPVGRSLSLEFRDEDGEVFRFKPTYAIEADDVVRLDYIVKPGKTCIRPYGGKRANGKFDGNVRLTAILGAYCSATSAGEVVFVKMAAGGTEIERLLEFDVDVADPLHLVKDSLCAPDLLFRSTSRDSCRWNGVVRFRDHFGRGFDKAVGFAARPGDLVRIPMNCDMPYKGVWYVTAELAEDGGRTGVVGTRFAVVDMHKVTPILPKPFFRMGVNFHAQRYWNTAQFDIALDAIVASGAKLVRSGGFKFADVAEKPEYDWTMTDAIFNALRKRGLSIDANLYPGPAWARDKPSSDIGGLRHAMNIPTREGLFRDFCGAVAARYGAGIDYYEIGNEWDMTSGMILPPDAALRLLREGYSGVKGSCPEATVTTCGWAGADPSDFSDRQNPGVMERIASDGKDAFDVWAIHLHGPFESYEKGIQTKFFPFRKQERMDGKPWYSNETALVAEGGSEDDAARAVWQKILYAWAWGSTDYIWYNLRAAGRNVDPREDAYGLFTQDYRPRATFSAFSALAWILEGGSIDARLVDSGRRHIYRFCSPGNSGFTIAGWDAESRDGENLQIRSDAKDAWVVDLMGNRSMLHREKDGLWNWNVSHEPSAIVLDGATFAVPEVCSTNKKGEQQ